MTIMLTSQFKISMFFSSLRSGNRVVKVICTLLVISVFATILYTTHLSTQFWPSTLYESNEHASLSSVIVSAVAENPAENPTHEKGSTSIDHNNVTNSSKVSKPKATAPKTKGIKDENEKLLPNADVFRHEDSYKKYMQCPTTLRNKLIKSKVFKDRFIADIPVLMWDEHKTLEEYNRLSQYWGCYGWQGYGQDLINRTLSYLNSPSHRYMFDNQLNLKGQKSGDNKCIRCAVVGGGGILNGSRKGEEIDSHDYVFRVNIAATKGYEVDVGKKTSFYSYTITTMRNSLLGGRKRGFTVAPHDKETKYLVFPCEISDYILVENRSSNKTEKDFKDTGPKHWGIPKFGKTVKNTDFKMLHPDFQRYMEWYWIRSSRKYKKVNRPSTGALMLIAAIHTCDEVSAYGFGVNFRKYTTHYYDKQYTKFVYYANHDFKQELKLWNDLDAEGIIKLYKRADDK
ncbi:alpha-N-acetylgalactosaminide alpha-2,6-sialyltransferase 2-like [Saccoglossus kowalevskii]